MPRFYFDIFDGAQINPDQIGIELSDPHVARVEATRTLSEIAAQELPGNGPQRSFHIVVMDADRTMLFEVHLDFTTIEGLSSTAENDNGDGN